MDADKALELATKAFPNDIEFRTAYMLGLNEGYELHKEQMMKEAVEGEFWNTPFPTICLVDCKNYNFKDNQKVKIIIVKED